MSRAQEFKVLFASDGSPSSKAALKTGLTFPWPEDDCGYGVVVKDVREQWRFFPLSALDETTTQAALNVSRALARRWPASDVRVVEQAPLPGVLSEARRLPADAIVMGWRGHGPARRLLAGSVSRGVVRMAACPVLVVRTARPDARHLVVGFDGSASSRAAVRFVARLRPPRGGRVTLVTATAKVPFPSHPLLGQSRASVTAGVQRVNAERVAEARQELEKVSRAVAARGWKTEVLVTSGAPLRDLLGTVAARRADVLVVGARGTSGVARLLLGSVAEGALDRSTVPVLIVR